MIILDKNYLKERLNRIKKVNSSDYKEVEGTIFSYKEEKSLRRHYITYYAPYISFSVHGIGYSFCDDLRYYKEHEVEPIGKKVIVRYNTEDPKECIRKDRYHTFSDMILYVDAIIFACAILLYIICN